MNLEKVLNYQIKSNEISFSSKDSALYALGVNLGQNPTDEQDLTYLYEDGMEALPTLGMVLAHPGFWLQDPDLNIDWVKILHAEQYLSLSKPLPANGDIKASYKVLGVKDKGPEKGCILYYEKILKNARSDEEYCRVISGVFCRGDGGCGDAGTTPPDLQPVPSRPADASHVRQIDPRAALIYRLSGDYNPIHISPPIAAKAGYDRPILHGLCTMGLAGYVLLNECAGGDPQNFAGMSCRFSKPVFPGDTVRTDIWKEGQEFQFRVVVEDRDEVVLDRGRLTLKRAS
ncbi:MaoC/PaaZ C-terminal domain-containing protein [Sneathiella sp.]|jgi:acyl dehydratase|uniref:MaoC/PaaZ C-terminal domain-containing protein n=1 Tax=Sneathiella sp. TaxID=1964365 RepID=UPI0039E32271